MGSPVNDTFNAPPGQTIVFGSLPSEIDIDFVDGVASEFDLSTTYGQTDVVHSDDVLPAGMTLFGLYPQKLVYDGTPGAANKTITLTAIDAAASFRVENSNVSSAPASIGTAFPRGALFAGSLGTTDGQAVEIRRRWEDGSVKHVVATGTFTANKTIYLTNTPVTGTPLTEANIAAQNPSAVVTLTDGTVSLADLLGNPILVPYSNPHMVEAIYKGTYGVTDLETFFHVRYYASGHLHIRASIERPVMVRGGSTDSVGMTLSGNINIEGQVTDLTGFTVYKNAKFMYEAWRGTQVSFTVWHDTAKLMATKLVPQYGFATSVSESRLNGYTRTYVPGDVGDYRRDQPATGASATLAILPGWEAAFFHSGGDYRAYQAIIANAFSYTVHAVTWRNDVGQILIINDNIEGNSNYARIGPPYTGTGRFHNGPSGSSRHTWDGAHNPSVGYLAYLLTGETWHMETMHSVTMTYYQRINPSTHGFGTGRLVREQTRETGWMMRSAGQLSAILPDNHRAIEEMREWQMAQITYAADYSINQAGGDTDIGVPFAYSCGTGCYPRPWMHDFWIQSVGYASEIGAVSDTDLVEYNRIRDFMYKFVVGRLGPDGAYCFAYAAEYSLWLWAGSNEVGSEQRRGSLQLETDWATLYAKVPLSGGGPLPCTNVLQRDTQGVGGAISSEYSYWANFTPAISYARQHAANGIDASWSRVQGADNYDEYLQAYVGGSGYAIEPHVPILTQDKAAKITVTNTQVPDDVDRVNWIWTPTKDGNGIILDGSVANLPLNQWVEVKDTQYQIMQDALVDAYNTAYNKNSIWQDFYIAGSVPRAFNGWSGMAIDLDGGRGALLWPGGHSDGYTTGLWIFNIDKMGGPDTFSVDIPPTDPYDDTYPWSSEYRNKRSSTTYTPLEPGQYGDELPGPVGSRPPTARHQYTGQLWDWNRRQWAQNRSTLWTVKDATKEVTRVKLTQGGTEYGVSYPCTMLYNEYLDVYYGHMRRYEGQDYYRWVNINPDDGTMSNAGGRPSGNFGGGGGSITRMDGRPEALIVLCNDSGRDQYTIVNLQNDTAVTRDISPGNLSYTWSNEMAALVWIPEWGLALRRMAGGAPSSIRGKFYTLNVDTGAQQERIFTGKIPRHSSSNRDGEKMFYYPKWGAVIYLSATTNSVNAVYVMRVR